MFLDSLGRCASALQDFIGRVPADDSSQVADCPGIVIQQMTRPPPSKNVRSFWNQELEKVPTRPAGRQPLGLLRVRCEKLRQLSDLELAQLNLSVAICDHLAQH